MAPVPVRPVRSTYARKRSRVLASTLPSSPQRLEEDITRSEMSRRMLKRCRRSHESMAKDLRVTAGVQERLAKKLKPSPQTQPGFLGRNAMTDRNTMTVTRPDFVQVDINDVSSYQTPFPSAITEQYKLKSSVGPPVPPELFSPLPAARRVLSRRSSRNLKENASGRSRSRGLASPFNSRPGSANSSPKKIDKGKRRPLVGSKSRTSSHNDKQNTQKRKPSVSVTNSTKNSPRPSAKKTLHNRRPSVPTPPSYTLQQIAHHEWFIPPRSLSRELSNISHFSDSPSQQIHHHSPFLGGFAQAYSTPLRKPLTHSAWPTSGACTPKSVHVTPDAVEYTIADLADANKDIVMMDNTKPSSDRPRCRRIMAPSGSGPCSLISSDSSTHSSPKYPIPANVSVPSVSNHANLGHLALLHLPNSPDNMQEDRDETDDSILPPTTKLHYAEHTVPGSPTGSGLRPDTSPYVLSSRRFTHSARSSLSPPMDPSLSAHPPWSQHNVGEMGGSDPVLVTPPIAQRTRSLVSSATSPASKKLKEMFSELDIDDTIIPTHDSGISVSDSPSHTHRMSRALESPVVIEARKTLNNGNGNKEKRYGKRNRAGTIRASDFIQPSVDNDIAAPSGSGITRTRSGTVIGHSHAPSRTRSGTIIGPSRPALVSKANMAPRHRHAHTRLEDDLGLGMSGENLPVLNSEDESEDELLMKAHWHDDDWVVAPAPVLVPSREFVKSKGKMRMWAGDIEPRAPHDGVESDDELLLLASKKKGAFKTGLLYGA